MVAILSKGIRDNLHMIRNQEPQICLVNEIDITLNRNWYIYPSYIRHFSFKTGSAVCQNIYGMSYIVQTIEYIPW